MKIPRAKSFDSTRALVADPYRFISRTCRHYDADLFETRLLLKKTICMTGPDAAKLFYDQDLFIRHGAMPGAIQKTLLGVGGVQGLDDDAHRHRKQMFMSLMTRERIAQLVQSTASAWEASLRRWRSTRQIVLYDEMQQLLMGAVCAWSGVSLAQPDVARRTREVVALFDAAGAVGPRHVWSRLARARAERWLMDFIDEIRNGRYDPAAESAASVIAWHRDPNGELLSLRIAAVELLNIIRPTVAIAVYMTLIAHALQVYATAKEQLQADSDAARCFVQEVRRFYPFFPAAAALTRQAFEWQGYQFPAGRRVMLDIFGTNHDLRTWSRPETFDPARFREWNESAYNFIPQGGGDHYGGHRCAGEWITIELMKQAVEFFTQRMSYVVPDQDLDIEWSRLPALPASRMVICNVMPK